MPSPQELLDVIYSPYNLCRIDDDYKKYKIYNGKLRDEIRDAITHEFILPETVKELCKRIIPINIIQKVINALAQVYKNPPQRTSSDDNQDDTESLQILAEVMRANQIGKSANRYFKLNKASMYEPYLDVDGIPRLRCLPSYSFTQYSDDYLDPSRPTYTIKHVDMCGVDRSKHVHVIWSNDEHFTMNGVGRILDNPGNPYGTNPLVYVKEGDQLMPIPDDDLYYLQIAICLLLTDLAFASKYQAWSIVYLIGVEAQKLSFNPNSVVTLPTPKDGTTPQIGTIKPTLDTAALLQQVEALIGLLLTTKNLSIGDMTMNLNQAGSPQAASAKILDKAVTTEDQTDQRQYFVDGETELWSKMAKNILPVWKQSQLLQPEYAVSFSESFKPMIKFEDPKPLLSEQDRVAVEKAKLDAGFTTKKLALQQLNPDMSSEQIDSMLMEINQEQMDSMNPMMGIDNAASAANQPNANNQ